MTAGHATDDLDQLQRSLRATLVGEGFSGIVLRSEEGNIIRVARSATAARTHQVMFEVLPRIAPRLPIAIPVPAAELPSSRHLPYGALTYPALPGMVAAATQMTRPIAQQLAAFLLAMHHLETSELGSLPTHVDDDHRWRELRAIIRPVCAAHFRRDDLQRLDAWWDRFLAAPARHRFAPSLCHGDPWYENLLLDESGDTITAMLDWETMNIGDPAQDLAPLRHAGDAFASAAEHHYVALSQRDDPLLADRVRWLWEAREFHGLRSAIEQDDAEELAEAVGKIRSGPILSAHRATP